MDSVACWAENVGLSLNVAKTKWMAVGNSSNGNGQMMNCEQVEPVEKFCYLGSILMNNGNCCKDVRTRIAKANLAFSRLDNIWRDRKLELGYQSRYGCTPLSSKQSSSTVQNSKNKCYTGYLKTEESEVGHVSPCNILSSMTSRLRNDLYCVEWDVKL